MAGPGHLLAAVIHLGGGGGRLWVERVPSSFADCCEAAGGTGCIYRDRLRVDGSGHTIVNQKKEFRDQKIVRCTCSFRQESGVILSCSQ